MGRFAPADAVLGNELVLIFAERRARRLVGELLLARARVVLARELIGLEHLIYQRLALESISPCELCHLPGKATL